VDPKVQPFSAARDVIANLKALQKGGPKPDPHDPEYYDQQIDKYTAEHYKNPGDKDAANALAFALYMKGRRAWLDTRLDAELRATIALDLFDRALEVNPNLVAAREDKAALEAQTRKAASGG
jgi:hypothetical protein